MNLSLSVPYNQIPHACFNAFCVDVTERGEFDFTANNIFCIMNTCTDGCGLPRKLFDKVHGGGSVKLDAKKAYRILYLNMFPSGGDSYEITIKYIHEYYSLIDEEMAFYQILNDFNIFKDEPK